MNRTLKFLGLIFLLLTLASSMQFVSGCMIVIKSNYISQLGLTEDPNIITAAIISPSDGKIYSNIVINLESLSISIPPTSLPPNPVNLELNETQQDYNSSFTYIANETRWLVTAQNDTVLINVSLNISNETEKIWFVNPVLKLGYLIVKVSDAPGLFSNASVYAVEFKTNLLTQSSALLEFHDLIKEEMTVYADEGLFFTRSIRSCVLGHYYRLNSDYKLEFVTTINVGESMIIDPRTRQFVVVQWYTNNLEVINYDTNDSISRVSKEFSPEEIDELIHPTTSTNSSALSTSSSTVTPSTIPFTQGFSTYLVIVGLMVCTLLTGRRKLYKK